MPNNSLSSGPNISFCAMRQVSGFHEPMRTRALFYLEQLAKQKGAGEEVATVDVNAAIGRAYRDRCDDEAIHVDPAALANVLKDAETGDHFRPLRELINAVSGGDS